MTDENDAAPVIVVLEIMVPRTQHILIGHGPIGSHRLAHHGRAQGRQGDLAIERRIGSALGREPCKLLVDHRALFGRDGHGRIAAGVFRHGGIDIETVDGRIGGGAEGLGGQLPISANNGSVLLGLATDIITARAAQPSLTVGIVDRCSRSRCDRRGRLAQGLRGIGEQQSCGEGG